MTRLFSVTAVWKTPNGNIGQWTGRWSGPDADTVCDAAAEYLRNDKRRRIASLVEMTAALEH
jgi:hypothetical protein